MKVFWTEADLVTAGILTSRRTAGRAVKRGDLPPPVKVGHRYLWHRESLVQFLQEKAARGEVRVRKG